MISLSAPALRTLSVGLLASLLASASPALAQTVALEPLTLVSPEGKTLVLSKVEATDTNLTKDELAKLFAKDTPAAERRAIAEKAKASRLTLGDVISEDKGQRFVIKGLEARDLDRGRVARVSFSGAEGTFKNENGDGKVTLNALTMDGLDLKQMVGAASSGKLLDGMLKVDRISFDGLEAVGPDKETPKDAPGGNLTRIKLGSASMDATYAGDVPTRMAMAIRGFTVQPAPASKFASDLKDAGLTQLELGVTFAGSFDPAAKVYAIDDFTFSMAQLGSVGLKAEIAGFDPALFTGDEAQRTAAAASLAFSGLTLRVVNAGGVEKGFAAAAAKQGKDVAALQGETAGMAKQIVPALLGGTPSAQATGAAIAAFVTSPKSLTLNVKPKAGPLGLVEAIALGDPMAVVAKLNIAAASEGAAAAPAAGAPQAGAAPAAPGGQLAQAGGEARKVKGLAALNAVIGNTITGKTADGDDGVWFYDKKGAVKQLVDDEVTAGKWAIRGEKICEEYPEDDEETCYTVEVVGSTVTFLDDDGNGRRYQIASGNPKKL